MQNEQKKEELDIASVTKLASTAMVDATATNAYVTNNRSNYIKHGALAVSP